MILVRAEYGKAFTKYEFLEHAYDFLISLAMIMIIIIMM
jgi:hypothetical protein